MQMAKKSPPWGRYKVAVALAFLVPLAACAGGGFDKLSTSSQHGYVISSTALEQVPIGSSREQVMIALGSPSTTANFGGEVFYYISQTRRKTVAFLPEKVVDQSVLAVYFDDGQAVKQIADYGLKDGKVFDFVTKTTPTGGVDESFLQQIISGGIGIGRNFGN